MALKMLTPLQQIEARMQQYAERSKKVLSRRVAYIAEDAINEQRRPDVGNWTDRTKNLRGSLGYKVNIDGTQKVNGLNPEASQEARDTSAAVIAKTMQKYREGIVIVACAGMPYAGPVSRRGYNVLDTAKLKIATGLQGLEDKMKRSAIT